MFYASQNNKQSEPDSFTVRMRGYGANAGQMAAQGAQTAAAGIGKGVKQGVYVTRVWAAPRLESVADYTTATVAPKVSTALRGTANQVRPADLKKSHSALTWSLFAAGVTAIAGAVTAMVRYKYRTATAADADDFDTAGSGTPTANPADASAESTTASTDAGANGRVSASGW